MTLPLNEYFFHLKSQGETTKEWYEGDFSCKCVLNNSEQLDVAIKTDRYSASLKALPNSFNDFNRIMAELEVRLIKVPHFWKESGNGWKLLDSNIVFDVFVLAMKAKDDWSERLNKQVEQAEQAAKAPKN